MKALHFPGTVILSTTLAAALFLPAARASAEVSASLKSKRRVAVYPFEIHSPKEDDKFLNEAFSDTLTDALTQVESLIVVERAQLKKLLMEQQLGQSGLIDEKTAAKTGKILGAQTAVLGHFTRMGSAGKAACRFADVETAKIDKSHLVNKIKSLSNDEDIFVLMQELAEALVKSFEITPTSKEITQMKKRTKPTHEYDAYKHYIKGREYSLRETVFGYESSIPKFKKAIEIDPKYALAHAALAQTYCRWGLYLKQNARPYGSYTELCVKYAKSAVDHGPDLSEAHQAMSMAYGLKGDLGSEKTSAQRALELNPNDAYAMLRVWGASRSPNPDDPMIHKALAVNPRMLAGLIDLGVIYSDHGLKTEAEDYFQRALKVNPRSERALINMGKRRLEQRKFQEALDYFKRALRVRPNSTMANMAVGGAYFELGNHSAAMRYSRKACRLGEKKACENVELILKNRDRGRRRGPSRRRRNRGRRRRR